MLFNSPSFVFLFLPIVVIIYFILNRLKLRQYGKYWLILSSLFFYSTVYQHFYIIIISLLVNFSLGLQITTLISNNIFSSDIFKNRAILAFGLIFNIGLLSYFKYTNFFIQNYNIASGSHIALLQLSLPLAISFYTFQQMSFIIDCYNRQTSPKCFLDYCVYVLFFPQLVAGPIVRHKEFMTQFLDFGNHYLNWKNLVTGLFVFSIGLFKKTIIADSFAVWANIGFNNNNNFGFLDAWAVSLSYTFQLYYDFSGYSDMAIGIALMFNIRLPINFNSPYKSLNIQEFWQRWHITLSQWLRDYLYIPLGGNRKGSPRMIVNIILTFIIGGLWHGAGWTFVVWGGLHGLALTTHRLWQKVNYKLPVILSWLFTFTFINIAWVFFRAPTVMDAMNVLDGMFCSTLYNQIIIDQLLQNIPLLDYIGVSLSDGILSIAALLIVYILIFFYLIFAAPNTMQLINFVPYSGTFRFRFNFPIAVVTVSFLFFSILTFLGNTPQGEFLYFNF